MSTTPSAPAVSPPASPSPPRIARFSDFLPSLDDHGAPAEVPRRRRGLYESLVGRPEPLYLDAQERPGKYPERTVELLERLVATGAVPTEEELRLLDEAVLLLADPRPAPGPQKERAPEGAPSKTQAAQGTGPTPPELPAPLAVPKGEPEPFWWITPTSRR